LKTATRDWLSGRTHRAGAIYEEILARITQPDRAGLDEVQVERMQLAVQYILGLLEAGSGIDRAEARAQFLESRRGLRVNAWRVRSLLQLNLGDAVAAQKAARRAELLQLQDASESHYLGTSGAFQLIAAFSAADVIAVRSAADLIATLAQSYPGWRPIAAYGQSCHRYLLGDLEGALESVTAGFTSARPGRHSIWGLLAAHHVRVLRESERTQEALEHAHVYMEETRRQELSTAEHFMYPEAARTLAVVGRHAEALAIIDPLIQRVESLGSSGLSAGTVYEARAEIAISMSDRTGFDHYAGLCAREYSKGNNPALSAKFARLMERAQQRSLVPLASIAGPSLRVDPAATAPEDDNTIVSRILECVDTSDRARCALMMLLQSSDGYIGYLYGANDNGLVPLAGVPDNATDPLLEQWLYRWLHAERERAAHSAAVTTATVNVEPLSTDLGTATADASDASVQASSDYVDAGGRRFFPIMLTHERDGERKVAALLAMPSEMHRRRPSSSLLAQIASQLLSHQDVQGVTLGEMPAVMS
jgi:hypothetical protein